jgi:hypothetical protein
VTETEEENQKDKVISLHDLSKYLKKQWKVKSDEVPNKDTKVNFVSQIGGGG